MKTIDAIICRLRKKLAKAGVPTLIDTVWGCGYILSDPSLDRPTPYVRSRNRNTRNGFKPELPLLEQLEAECILLAGCRRDVHRSGTRGSPG